MSKYNKLSVWAPLMATVMFILGFLAGDLINRENGPTAAQKKFQTILNLIRNEYVDEVDLDSLLENSIPGLLSNLDPHSAYIPASDLQAVNDDLDGSFSGVGVQFMLDNDTIKIIEVIPGGPSEKIGLLAGDRIIQVDNENVAGVGITTEQVFKRLRGEKGTKVQVRIKRTSSKKLLTFDITRGDIPVNTIDAAYVVSPGIGYVKVNKFGRTTYDEFFQALNKLRREGAEDFVIDLRGNTGGYMEIAYMMANEFMSSGETIVSTKGRDFSSNTVIRADGTGAFQDSQVVVLLDEYSASSSEIFAGALQDNDRALIIGRRSFGKGLIQTQAVLADSSAIRLTVGRYYTPSGRCIQKDYSNLSAYEHDIVDRYNRGEMFSADSIKFNTNLKYNTAHGRTVYGGGGIMPDIFIPNDTTGISSYYINVANAGLLQRFAFDFVDDNRETLKTAANISQLKDLLPNDESLLRQFVLFASRNGIPARWYYINISHDLLVNQLKALIARDALGYAAYYEIANTADINIRRAVDELLNGNAAFPILPTKPAATKK